MCKTNTITQTLVGYYMVAVLTDALVFLIREVVTIVTGEEVKNLPHSTDNNLNPLGPEDNTTKCFTCVCKFPWVYNCPFAEGTRNMKKDEKKNYLSLANIVLMSQHKQKDNGHTTLCETLGSAVLDSGTTKTVELNGMGDF